MAYTLEASSQERVDGFLQGQQGGVVRGVRRTLALLVGNPHNLPHLPKHNCTTKLKNAPRFFPQLPKGTTVWEAQLHLDVESAIVISSKNELIILLGIWPTGNAPWH